MEPNEHPDGLNYITPDTSSPAPTPPASTEPAPIPQAPPVSPVVPVVTPPVSNPVIENIPEPTPIKRGWFNKKIFYGVWILALLLAGAFSVYNYAFASPEKILAKMQAKFLEAKTFAYKGEMEAEYESQAFVPNFKAVMEGFVDFRDEKVEKSSFKMSIAYDKDSSLGAEGRFIGKDVYLKLNDLPTMLLSFIPDRMLEDWYHVDSEEIQKQFGLKMVEGKEENDLSEEEIKELYKSFRKNKVLEITEILKNEKIDGENSHHYKYKINMEGLEAFYKEGSKILGYEELALDDGEFEEVADITGEIWVGKKTSYLRKLTIFTEESDAKFTFSLSLFDFDKEVNIEKPSEAVELLDVIEGIGNGEGIGASTCGFDFTEGFDTLSVYKNTSDLILGPDSSTKVSVSGNQISWRSNNRSVAEADSTQGNTVNIKAYKKGKAQITISAAGASCDLKVYVTVSDQPEDFSFGFGIDDDGSGYSGGDDAKRIADIRQLSTALELYYNDNGGYPPSLAIIAPMYIAAIPSAPLPPLGNCTEGNNKYSYQPAGTSYMGTSATVYPEYQMTFCLGSSTAGYGAGPRTATPQGIQ